MYLHRCRSRQGFGVRRIFCPKFTRKLVRDKLFPYKVSLWLLVCLHNIFFYHDAIDLKICTWNFVLILTQLKKYGRLCKNIVRRQLVQCSENLPRSFGVFHLHSSCCCQQVTSHLAEVDLKLLPSLKTYVWYIWRVSYYLHYDYAVNLWT